ncbi:MAG: hypothetical protein R3C56_36205 [Pirellulaceae bacterium]
MFEIRGDVVADLAADYINPAGKAGVTAEFPTLRVEVGRSSIAATAGCCPLRQPVM